MHRNPKKYLYDIQQAASRIAEFTAGKRFEDYHSDSMLRPAVERQFEIIGEALAQLAKLDAILAARISGCAHIIAFRNVLIHGYADVDDRIVWDIMQSELPVLRHDVEALLNSE